MLQTTRNSPIPELSVWAPLVLAILRIVSALLLIDQGLNGLVSFTTAPMRLSLYIGFGLAFLSVFYAVLNLMVGLLRYRTIAEPGVMTLIVAFFFFGGIQLFFLGIIGEYILAIYGQVRDRPVVFERERINFGPEATDDRGGGRIPSVDR